MNERAAVRAKTGQTPNLRIGFLLADGFTLSALSLFIDALRLAADEGDRSRPIRCDWQILAARPEPIRSSAGLSISPTGALTDPIAFDYIVVVGGLLHIREQMDRAGLLYLKKCAEAGVPLVGVCTGSFILARAGLMTGRRSCVSWFHCDDFAAEFPDHDVDADRLFIDDEDRITCAGGGGVADLAAHLIRRHLDATAAQKSMHILQLQSARLGSDAQPHSMPAISDDSRVRRAILLMEQSVSRPMTVDAIALRLKISSRQLERLFRDATGASPASIYRQIRLRHARQLLLMTEKSVTDIAVETGFCDAGHFARQFRAFFGEPPRRVRSAHNLRQEDARTV
ncbi:GlxA family transcriptional regulator [Notoacmeibacter sp. MSK16QG-6]|uniref:GlxA family transcriptional regulator n=1 Tax=Notoacmeibacter sp. MSK16QG-6 TaxID=2957982 RepID=UPI0020A09B08|nr:GlxA family transcriptional regulator [Notoacmeibacter sp. MSK16QG-6]MCP1200788.1 GlxA family transcriptional regulator [Notoacmeibacter sp. MSK16QG-6]